MTDSVTSQKLKDHAAAWAYKFTNETDGTGDAGGGGQRPAGTGGAVRIRGGSPEGGVS